MNRFSFGSLRVRLILLVLIAIIPSLIIILLTGLEARRISGQNAKHDAMQLAVVASGNQDLLIEGTRQMLAGLARRPELHQEDSKPCSTLFADLLRQYKRYNNIIAVKSNGDLWCSGVPTGGSPNYADRGWFPEVMRTRDFVIGEYVIGRVTKKSQSSIAYPIMDAAGKVQKIIVTGFGLDWLNQFVAKTKLPPGSVLTVIDRNFTVLARTLEPDKWVGQTVKQAPIVNTIRTQQGQGTLETTGIDGIKRLYAFAPLGTQTSGSVYVFIGIPTSVAYAQTNWILTRNLIALGLASLLAFIVAWVGSNLFLLRHINALLHTAKRLEDGNLSARTGKAYGTGELSKLAHAFDRMAESLEQRIAERQRAEELLREQLYFLQQLLDAIPLPIFYKDRKGMFRGCNVAYEKFLGMTKEQVVGKTVFGVAPQDLANIYYQADEALFTQPGAQVYETSFLHADGNRHDIIFNKATYVGTDGYVAGLVGVILDITERKRMEEEKRGLEERLQRSEKMEALGQLAGGVAHDLNNVLGILSGYSELLLEEIPDGHRSRGHVEKILQSTEKGAAIIQDLLTLARRGVTASDVINLNSVVSGFLKTPVFEKMKDYHPRVTFRTECDKNVLNIKGSPIHLEKTLINLVSNAAESISGKGEVTIRTESRYLDKAVRGYDEVKEGDYAVLTVSDTGMGIPAENREKIFEPFYTKKTMGRSGTGLGLSIVWGTVKDHHGYIDVQTEVGTGTTFTLYFPVTREELIAPQQKEPIERYMGNGESVLVVDDIAEQRDVAARLLTRLGYEVHVVSGGEEAVEYLKGHTADILVLDMIMTPGIDGLETYQRVLAINPKQKAILVSGFSETERVTKAQKLGAGAYVKKPYAMERIGAAIRDELNR